MTEGEGQVFGDSEDKSDVKDYCKLFENSGIILFIQKKKAFNERNKYLPRLYSVFYSLLLFLCFFPPTHTFIHEVLL